MNGVQGGVSDSTLQSEVVATGGDAGDIALTIGSVGTMVTTGDNSSGVTAQSIGGGGARFVRGEITQISRRGTWAELVEREEMVASST